ncbi:MAG: B12-binding domain-containing radical SAM protein, partial [Candidatus Latescibacterota bacterium]
VSAAFCSLTYFIAGGYRMNTVKSLTIALIRPSNYDDDGYVIRYWRGVFPSNTLACLRSLTQDFAERWKRDLDISISVELYDEIIDKLPFKRLARKNLGSHKVVGVLAGVQSNQFPRASDIAKKMARMGVKTLIGGFHISGVLAMFKEPSPEIQELMDCGVTVVQGEAEQVWESILSDVVQGKEKSLYRSSELPDISTAPIPQIYAHSLKRYALADMGTIDCSRGCPFKCSFCTIINVQGSKMRCRNADHVLASIRNNYQRGIRQYFFTDDNFSRNPSWEAIFDGLARLHEEEGLDVRFIMQVDMACDKIPNFIAKAKRAGCSQVFIGMESLNPQNIASVGKTQNKVDHYAEYIDTWHQAGILTHVGYIIGFPYDTPESIKRNIETLKNEIKVDMASFFILTPLPGSKDHYDRVCSGAYLDPDLNKYDSFHTVTDHPLMSREELYESYTNAWKLFYGFDNLKMVLARARQHKYWDVSAFNLMWYKNSLLEPRHPMVTGFIRRKSRRDIRPGYPVPGAASFFIQRTTGMFSGILKRLKLTSELQELWWLTRKPDDNTFKLVSDFSSALNEAKHRITSIDFSASYKKWQDEMSAISAALSEKISVHYNSNLLREKSRRKLNRLIEDTKKQLENISREEYYNRGVASFTHFLNENTKRAEELALKYVQRRRAVTQFWKLTIDRIRRGKVFPVILSSPKIFYNMIRDVRMSTTFAHHFFINKIWRQKKHDRNT